MNLKARSAFGGSEFFLGGVGAKKFALGKRFSSAVTVKESPICTKTNEI